MSSVDSGSPRARHDTLFQVLRESADAASAGEVVVRHGDDSARIFVTDGRIAWTTTSTRPVTFRRHLVDRGLIGNDDLKQVFHECRVSGENFAEKILEWKLMDSSRLRRELLTHVAANFAAMLSWASTETLFIPVQRSYSGKFTFDLPELLLSAAAVAREGGQELAEADQEIRLWLRNLSGRRSEGGHLRPVPRSEGSAASRREERKEHMDIAKLRQAFDEFKRNAGDGLLASDVFTRSDAQSIMGYNSNPAACALFAQVITYIDKSLKGSKFPPVNRYLYLELVDNKSVILVNLGPSYVWGMLCDTSQIQIGLLTNVILPEAIEKFMQVLAPPPPPAAVVSGSTLARS